MIQDVNYIIEKLKSNQDINLIEYIQTAPMDIDKLGRVIESAPFKLPDSFRDFYLSMSSLSISWEIKPDSLKKLAVSEIPDRHSIYFIRGNIDILDPQTVIHDFINRDWNYLEIISASEKLNPDVTDRHSFLPFDFASGNNLHVGFSDDTTGELLVNDQAYDIVAHLGVNFNEYTKLLTETMGFWQWPLIYSAPDSPEADSIKHYIKQLFGRG